MKQSKEKFLENVELHAKNYCAWGTLVDWEEAIGAQITVEQTDEQIALDQQDCEVSLDKELDTLFNECRELENKLIASVRKLNTACRKKLGSL